MTPKQYTAIKNVVETNGSIAEAMRVAEYAPSTVNQPQVLTKSKAWQEIMEEHLDNNKIFTKHEEALEATKWNDFTGEREEDHNIRLKAVDMAYKLKGYLKDVNTGGIVVSVRIIRDERQRTIPISTGI